jgi:BolA family transcriptional regulator, general stress-responsive regulator
MLTPEKRPETIYEQLETALQPSHLEVIDDSQHHVGHSGHGGAGHFTVKIVSSAFAGKSLVARHRLVYDALKNLMQDDIHALSIEAKTEEEK